MRSDLSGLYVDMLDIFCPHIWCLLAASAEKVLSAVWLFHLDVSEYGMRNTFFVKLTAG